MIGYVMATLHLLHTTDIISPQYQQSVFKRRRPQGEATMRDVATLDIAAGEDQQVYASQHEFARIFYATGIARWTY